MPDEVFRTSVGAVTDERAVIDQVWADVLRQNRWRLRVWRLVNRVRACLWIAR